ncbi:oxidoreductase [Sphingobium sp.]|uniref:oxidoreductase n=1 Tax=Sphingobium sp. TaxID=1912891 RepID=UPI003BB502C2
MSDRLRVGLIGYGMAGRVFHAPLVRAVPDLDLVAIATSRHDEVAALDPAIGCVADPQDIFADPTIDLVVIATPSATHAPLAAQALQAGKHVVVDKPFALTLADARSLATLAKAHGRHLAVFHNRRFDSDYLSIAHHIANGAIGRVTHFESHFDRFRPEIRDRWREDGSAGSGVWFDLGPHLVDQAIALFGTPLGVSADIAGLRAGSASDDWAHVILRYPDLRVILHASLNAPDGTAGGSPRFAVHGTGGSLIKQALDLQEAQLIAGLRPGDAGWGHDPDPVRLFDGNGAMRECPALAGCQDRFYRQLASTIRSGTALPVPINDALAVQAVIDAAMTSSQKGRYIDMMGD